SLRVLLTVRGPPGLPVFPYTTLFRSVQRGSDLRDGGQGTVVPRVQRGKTRRWPRPFPGARAVRPVLHPGACHHRAVPGTVAPAGPLCRGPDRLAQARSAVPRRRRRGGGPARAGGRTAGGDVRLHLHGAPERGTAPAAGHRRAGGAWWTLLVADPAPEVPARPVRPV